MQSIAGGYANLFPKDLWLVIGEGMIGHAAASGKTQLSGDVSKHPHYVRKAKEETKSELVVPIKSAQKVIAVLDLQSDEFDAFDETDVMVMETLADQIAVAIENVRLYEAVQQELTERKQAEEALRVTEERHRKLFEEAQDGIILADAKTGVIVDCNYEAAKLVNRDKSELIGQHQTILHPSRQTNENFSETFQNHLGESEGRVLETQVITSTGEIKEVGIKASLLHIGDRKLLHGIFRDISEQKQAEAELIQTKKFLQNILDSSIDGITTTDRQGNVIYASPRTKDIIEYNQEETISEKVYSIYSNGIEDAKIITHLFLSTQYPLR